MDVPYIEDLPVAGGVGVADNTPAFNYAVQNFDAVRFRDAYPGLYTFATEPDIIPKSFAIYGAYPNVPGLCYVLRNYQPSSPDRALFHSTAFQFYVNDLAITATAGNGGQAIHVKPDAGKPLGNGGLNHLRISAAPGASWRNTVIVDGSNNTNPSGPGARVFSMDDVTCFGTVPDPGSTDNANVIIRSVVNFNCKSASISQAPGTNCDLLITGTPSAPSYYSTFRLGSVLGNLILSQLNDAIFEIAHLGGSIINDSTVSGVFGRGKVYGTIQNNWVGSRWN